jgi:hypothetical protein
LERAGDRGGSGRAGSEVLIVASTWYATIFTSARVVVLDSPKTTQSGFNTTMDARSRTGDATNLEFSILSS